DLLAGRELDARDLAQRRVRLLRRHRAHHRADAALLAAAFERGRLGALHLGHAALPHELVDRRHSVPRGPENGRSGLNDRGGNGNSGGSAPGGQATLPAPAASSSPGISMVSPCSLTFDWW